MIYQHRMVQAFPGKLLERNRIFENEFFKALDEAGSVLIGAWEVWIGREPGHAVYQLRQFDSLAAWAEHQDRVSRNDQLANRRQSNLLPQLEFVDTSIVRLAIRSPLLPSEWPAVQDVKGQPSGFLEQRILRFHPEAAAAHHDFYFNQVVPALASEDTKLLAFFDTVIGPGTMNAASHRSIELRWFAGLAEWQRWRERQENDPQLLRLVKQDWLSRVASVETTLMRPLDYSRIR